MGLSAEQETEKKKFEGKVLIMITIEVIKYTTTVIFKSHSVLHTARRRGLIWGCVMAV